MHRHGLRRNQTFDFAQLTQQQIIDLINLWINNNNTSLIRDQLREILEQLAGLAGSGGGTVTTDPTLTGDGSVGDPLGINVDGVATNKIVDGAVTAPKINSLGATVDLEVMAFDQTAGEWAAKLLTLSGSGSLSGDDNSIDFVVSPSLGAQTVYQSNGAVILASDAGITFSKSPGLGTFTIPPTVWLHKFWFTGAAADWPAGEFSIVMSGGFGSGTAYNTADADMIFPDVTIQKRNVITSTQPYEQAAHDATGIYDIFNERFVVSNDPKVRITGLSGDIRIIGNYL